MTDQNDNRALSQALAQYQSVAEMVATLQAARDSDDSEAADEAREAILSDPLSARVRSGWQSISEKLIAEEFELLLCTGGPAVRIVGELDQWGEPTSASLEYQDWFTEWKSAGADLPDEAQETLLTYCREFYFGD